MAHPFYNFITITGVLFLASINPIHAFEDPKIELLIDCLQTQFRLDTPSLVFTQNSNASYYNVLNRQWNRRKAQTFPLAYFVPKSTTDVQAAVKCGHGNQLPLIPNSGGHSYEGLSYGDNSSIIIDFRIMNNVEVSGDGSVVIMQPGILLGQMIAHLWSAAKVSLPVGNCLTVGIGGHSVGGGVGFYAQRYGLLIDNILEYEMVSADGNVVRASATQNPDLFWGIRGMGAGYLGIVTSIKAKTFRADAIQVTSFFRAYSTNHFVDVMKGFQSWMEWVGDDHSVYSMFYLINDNYNSNYPKFFGGGFQLGLIHISDPNDLEYPGISQDEFVRKARQLFPPDYIWERVITPSFPEHIFFSTYTPISSEQPTKAEKFKDWLKYLDNLKNYDGKDKSGVGDFELPSEDEILQFFAGIRKQDAVPRYFRAKSMYVKRKLNNGELERLYSLLQRIPNNTVWITVNSERGALGSIPKTDMAFVHRDSLTTWNVNVETPDISDIRGIGEAEEWLGEWWGSMTSFDGGETYQNYPDLQLGPESFDRYYASNLAQLKATKREWDPENFFRDPISIPLS